ncbi:MAG TPA: hypothetical protein VJN44_03400, partial [Roseateles sp.]|nr:hypothetical protein [Roseateles sp.]
MLARLLAFVVWALLACVSVFWWLKLSARPLPVPPQAVPAIDAAGPRANLSRLLGEPQAAAAPLPAVAGEGRYKLVGLVAPKQAGPAHAGEGVAMIAVDGAPPRPVRVGAAVDGEMRLLALDGNSAALGNQGVVSLKLTLAPPAPANTGSLPVVRSEPLPGQEPAAAPPTATPPLPSMVPSMVPGAPPVQ